MIAMVNHLAGHATVDADVLARDEASFVGAEVHHHIGDIHGIADATCGLLSGIGTLIDGACSVYPAWRDGIDPYTTRKADCQRMGQCGNTALGSGIALGLGLAHTVTRGGYIHDGSPLGKKGSEEFSQIERGCNANAQGILELLVTALVDSLHQRQGVIDEIVHPAIFVDDLLGKPFQYLLVGNITHVVVSLLLINHADVCARLLKLIGDTTSYSLCSSSHDDYFILKIHC